MQRTKKDGTRGRNTKRSLKSFRLFGKTKKNASFNSVTPDMVKQAEDICLPPKAPDPIADDGKSDVSVFFSTFNLDKIHGPLSETNVAFWLPLGYDVYALGLQSVEQMSQTGTNILNFLQSKGDSYQEFTHFVTVEEPGTQRRTSIITYLYVHSTLVKDQVFQRKTLFKVQFPPRVPDAKCACSGAFVVNFTLFDTDVQVVNCQLTKGKDNQDARVEDLRFLMNRLKEDEADVLPDHVFLMGDFSTALEKEMDDMYLRTFITSKSSITDWNHERFRFLLEQYDELETTLRKQVPELKQFTEVQIMFPPTSHRLSSLQGPVSKESVAEIFHPAFDLEELFEYKEELPCYPDRIFYLTKEECYQPCLKVGRTGTCEGVRVNRRVPVFSTFRIGARSLGGSIEPKSAKELESIRKQYHASTQGLKTESKKKLRNTHAREQKRTGDLQKKPSGFNKSESLPPPPPPPPDDDRDESKRTVERLLRADASERTIELSIRPEKKPSARLEPEPAPKQDANPWPIVEPKKLGRVVKKRTDVVPEDLAPQSLRGPKLFVKQKSYDSQNDDYDEDKPIKLVNIANFSDSNTGIEMSFIKESQRNQQWDEERVGNCASCYKPVYTEDSHLNTSGKLFHEQCFNCERCREKITEKYYFINDLLYCHKCHDCLFHPTCLRKGCGKNVEEDRVDTDKGAFHKDCFSCTKCNVPLAEVKKGEIIKNDYFLVGDELFCAEHGKRSSGQTCLVCKRILDQGVQPYENLIHHGELFQIHNSCLKCSKSSCRKVIPAEKFQGAKRFCYLLKDGKIFCGQHGKMTCGGCKNKIYNTDGFRDIFDVKCHVNCVPGCKGCGKELSSRETLVQTEDGGLMCEKCGAEESERLAKEFFQSEKHLEINETTGRKKGRKLTSTGIAGPDIRKLSVLPKTLFDIESLMSHPPPPPPLSVLDDEFRSESRLSRPYGRSTVFTGFTGSIPPPPPLSQLGKSNIDKKATQDAFQELVEDSESDEDLYEQNGKLRNIVKRSQQHRRPDFDSSNKSLASVQTNISQTIGMADQLQSILRGLNTNASLEFIDPPPPTPSMLKKEKEEKKKKRLSKNRKMKNGLPPPPASPMHGNVDDTNTVFTSFVDRDIV